MPCLYGCLQYICRNVTQKYRILCKKCIQKQFNTNPSIFHMNSFCFIEVLSLGAIAICTLSYPVAGIIVLLIVMWCLLVAKNRQCHVARCLGVCFWP